MSLGWVPISHYPSRICVLKSEKTQTHTQTNSKQRKPIELNLVPTGTRIYKFCCHTYQPLSIQSQPFNIMEDALRKSKKTKPFQYD